MIGVGATRERSVAPPAARRQGAEGEWNGWSGLDLGSLDPDAERPYWVALSLVPGLGPVSFGRLLARYGSGRAAWDAGHALLAEVQRLPTEAPGALRRLRREGAAAVLRRMEGAVQRVDGRILTALDPHYPAALRHANPRPAVLYHAGDPAAFDAVGVAVVGTRRASGYGRSSAIQIADELGRARVTVISGLALGIDGDAHAAAIEAGGRSVAVLPSPLDRIYPPRHRNLAARLVQSGGGLVTELAPGQLPGRPDFARRNRIIAGLAVATVVVEAPDRSGALLTAAAAAELDREVFAVPGPIDAIASRGCNRLIADHLAELVTSPAGLLTSIGIAAGRKPVGVEALSDSEALVLAKLLKRPASVEELIGRTDLSAGALAGSLTLLEARGLVTSYGGATFHPTLAARRLGRVL